MSAAQPFHTVLLFPQAVETLGEALSAYVAGGPLGPHIVCRQVNASGAFFEMIFDGKDEAGKPVEIEVMVPHGFIRMVLSIREEGGIGFGRGGPLAAAGLGPY
jgi:hypothetical protein